MGNDNNGFNNSFYIYYVSFKTWLNYNETEDYINNNLTNDLINWYNNELLLSSRIMDHLVTI